MRSIQRVRLAFVLVAALGLLGLSACADPKKTPTYVCDAGVSAAAEPAQAASAPPDAPLAVSEAGEEAKAAVAEAEVLTPDGRVPLVTVEETPSGPEVTSTPVANEAEAEAVAEAAAADGDLVVVEPDSVVSAEAMPPDDEFFEPEQYAFDLIDYVGTWDDAYSGPRSGAGQTVAVLDTGVQASHPDLDDGRVLAGAAFGQPGAATEDPHGHGTRIAGIVAAETDNMMEGIAGAAPAADILPVKVLDANGKGFSSHVADGLKWAAENGATIINLSLGGPTPSDAVLFMVRYAVSSKGVPVISSSGNSGKCGAPAFPAAYSEVVAVGSTDQTNQWASFSTTGPYVDLVAPGVAIRSTLNNGAYGDSTGTSFSTPYVAAAAAIVRATHPGFDANQVIFRLVTTANDLGPPGWDPHFGFGIVNMPAAAA
ncbi:MAG: S8 family serine peptidase [Acidimicrobiia bacterium]